MADDSADVLRNSKKRGCEERHPVKGEARCHGSLELFAGTAVRFPPATKLEVKCRAGTQFYQPHAKFLEV
jgi:hypothetical protein